MPTPFAASPIAFVNSRILSFGNILLYLRTCPIWKSAIEGYWPTFDIDKILSFDDSNEDKVTKFKQMLKNER